LQRIRQREPGERIGGKRKFHSLSAGRNHRGIVEWLNPEFTLERVFGQE
jgi:hypothetical protein